MNNGMPSGVTYEYRNGRSTVNSTLSTGALTASTPTLVKDMALAPASFTSMRVPCRIEPIYRFSPCEPVSIILVKSASPALNASVTPSFSNALMVASESNMLSMVNRGSVTFTMTELTETPQPGILSAAQPIAPSPRDAVEHVPNAQLSFSASPANSSKCPSAGSTMARLPPLSNGISTRCQVLYSSCP